MGSFSGPKARAWAQNRANGEACRTGSFRVRGMPQNRNGSYRIRSAALLRGARGAALAAFVVCAGTAAAHAGDDGNSSPSFYDEMLQAIGVDTGPTIDYSERSPLVVPPTLNLPPPQASRPPAVADWPHDPDMAGSAKASVKKQARRPFVDYTVVDPEPLRPDQLGGDGADTRSANAVGPNIFSTTDDPGAVKRSTGDLFSKFNPFASKTEYATFTGEPARTTLTDPPPGYLTPSPDQPYGVGPRKAHYAVPTLGSREAAHPGD